MRKWIDLCEARSYGVKGDHNKPLHGFWTDSTRYTSYNLHPGMVIAYPGNPNTWEILETDEYTTELKSRETGEYYSTLTNRIIMGLRAYNIEIVKRLLPPIPDPQHPSNDEPEDRKEATRGGESYDDWKAKTLAEAKMVTDPRRDPFAIWQNPGKSDIAQLADHRDLRGFIHDGKVYVWYACMGIHGHGTELLGITSGKQTWESPAADPFYIMAAHHDSMSADGQSEWTRTGIHLANIGGCRVYVDKWRKDYLNCPAFVRMIGGHNAELVGDHPEL